MASLNYKMVSPTDLTGSYCGETNKMNTISCCVITELSHIVGVSLMDTRSSMFSSLTNAGCLRGIE